MNNLEEYAIIVNYEVSDSETDQGDPSNENHIITEDEVELKMHRHLKMEEEFNHDTFVKKDIKSGQETGVMITELESESGEKITINMIKSENETEHVTDQASVNQDYNSNKIGIKSENVVYNCPKIDNCNATSDFSVQCKRCEHCFTDNLQYLDHKVLCVAEKDSDKTLEIKIETDEITKPYSDKTFQSGKDMQETETLPLIKQQMSSSEKDFTCGTCGKTLSDKWSLRRHTETHSNATFKCHICDKRYYDDYRLKRHLEQHGERKLCSKCGKEFTTEFWLKRHEKTVHEGKAAFSCKTCGKSCSTAKVLEGHEVKHAGAHKPYRCDVCGRCYLLKASLRQHKCKPKTPTTDMKQYSCTTCQKSFSSAKFLKQHQNVHKEPLFVCEICGKGFRWKNSLTFHKKLCVQGNSDND